MTKLLLIGAALVLFLGSVVLKSDPGTDPDFQKLWGNSSNALVSPSRVTLTSDHFRRINLKDGDTPPGGGERAQIGRNAWNAPTFYVFHEGDHRIVSWSMRFPNSFPRTTGKWQQILQLKQAQPYSNDDNRGDGDKTQGVALEVQIINGRVELHTWWRSRGSLPMPAAGKVIPCSLDVVESQMPTKGSVSLTCAGSTVSWKGATMAYEKATGATIPSALMMGVYRDASITGTTFLDVGNVKVSTP